MKSDANKWVIPAIVVVIVLLAVWWFYFKVDYQRATVATIIAIDRENRVMEIQTETYPSVKIRYKKDIQVEIGKDYLIVYNNYKFRDPVLSSIK